MLTRNGSKLLQNVVDKEMADGTYAPGEVNRHERGSARPGACSPTIRSTCLFSACSTFHMPSNIRQIRQIEQHEHPAVLRPN
jgi:hypothetical protein